MSFLQWLRDPVPWWKFWRPGSGIVGGLVFAVVLWTPFELFHVLYYQ